MDEKMKDLFRLLNALDAMVDNYCQAIVDEEVRANAENSHLNGLKSKIIRTTDGHCCEWCTQQAGEYDYPNVPKDVYRRHQNCGCSVDYVNEKNKWQNVHSKKYLNNADIQSRINKINSLNIPDIYIAKSVGAKSLNYEVLDFETFEKYDFVEGTKIQNIQVFAGKGTNVTFRMAKKYANKYGGKQNNWQHVKGFGILNTEDGQRRAEVHWVQCTGIGKFEFFVKRWLD